MIQYFKEGSKVYFKEGQYKGLIGEVLGDECVLLTVRVKLADDKIVEVQNLILKKEPEIIK